MSASRNLRLITLVMAVVAGLDQLTKYLVRTCISVYEAIPAHGFFQIIHTENTGAAFSIFQGATPYLIFASCAALVFIAWLAMSHRVHFLENPWGHIGLGLAAGGTLGNLIDRVHYGFVTDFIKAGPWPVFNVADSSVVIGMILIAFLYLRSEQTAER